MRFWIDENISRFISRALEQAGHEIFTAPSKTGDPIILQLALEARVVLVTHDHDFERYALKEKGPCTGVILMQSVPNKRIEELSVKLVRLIKTHEHILTTRFILLSPDQFKIFKLK